MVNQGNILPGGGKEISKFTGYKEYRKGTSCGVPTTEEMETKDFSVTGKSTTQLNVRKIGDAPGARPDPRKRTMLPESDDALAQIATIEKANLSQGVFTHEQNVDIPWEGFNDPANRKV